MEAYWNPGKICNRNYDDYELAEGEETEPDNNWPIDYLQVLVPLWHKHNLKVHGFEFSYAQDGSAFVTFTITGSKEKVKAYYNDEYCNRVHYLERVMEIFETAPAYRDAMAEFAELERKREVERNPPPRPKYDPVTHKFVL